MNVNKLLNWRKSIVACLMTIKNWKKIKNLMMKWNFLLKFLVVQTKISKLKLKELKQSNRELEDLLRDSKSQFRKQTLKFEECLKSEATLREKLSEEKAHSRKRIDQLLECESLLVYIIFLWKLYCQESYEKSKRKHWSWI